MKITQGQVAAVTGAGSGIGRALALELAERGVHLALCDIDAGGLDATVKLCEQPGIRVTSRPLDVAERDAVRDWAAQTVEAHDGVQLVINNAGVALGAAIEQMSDKDFEWLMGINFWGVVNGTQAFLPHLVEAGEGHIVNISSVFGLLGIPSQSAYCAAKFAVRGFTDVLRMELEISGSGVSATTVHPGGIRTNIARSARIDPSVAGFGATPERAAVNFDRIARTSPTAAAHRILTGVERNRRRVLIGADARVFDLVSRMPAGVHQRVLVAGGRRLARARPPAGSG